ncbi:MAG: 50S ribosomal protein L13 [Rhizobiales bacterium TMED168]|nr:MAG: 50S ribosomal protein L13 [Rhizobiales bacterium TMED168]|tara:strand:- start:7082 stop:7546 length:465 start_codon:yes stop_codon:yes gene_type:complete
MKSTVSTKQSEVTKKWILIDASNLVVGRLAAFVANRLRGKHLPSYTPHVDDGDNVIIVNAEKIHFTGNKFSDKVYYKHTGFPGGIKSTTPEKILEGKFPERVLQKAIRRMMPTGPLSNTQFGNLKVYSGPDHPHEAQKPEIIDVSSLNNKNVKR